MSVPTPTYALNKEVYYHAGFHDISFWLHAGERCRYFAHSDTYLFEARSGVVPFFKREYVESNMDLFSPIEKSKWEPWVTYDKDPPVLDIQEPPCPSCKFWKPQPIYVSLKHHGIKFDGVRLCHAEEMNPDFSCFTEAI